MDSIMFDVDDMAFDVMMIDKLLSFLQNVKDPEIIRCHALKFKERGNYFYRRNNFKSAILWYSKSMEVLSLASSFEIDDEAPYQDLMVHLNLNLAACSLKLHDYEETREFCSLVLEVVPDNVKALFRRALAMAKMGRLEEAHFDLCRAYKLEPHDKEIMRELVSVESLLKSSMLDKNQSCVVSTITESRMEESQERGLLRSHPSALDNHKGTPMEVDNGVSLFKSCDSTLSGGDNIPVMEGASPQVLGRDESVTPTSSSYGSNKEISVESKLHFVNRRKRNLGLQVSKTLYNDLIAGKEVEFYLHGQASVMKVRVLNPHTLSHFGTTKGELMGQQDSSQPCESVSSNSSYVGEDQNHVSNLSEASCDSSAIHDGLEVSSHISMDKSEVDPVTFHFSSVRKRSCIRRWSVPITFPRFPKGIYRRLEPRLHKRKFLDITNPLSLCRLSGMKRKTPPTVMDEVALVAKKPFLYPPAPDCSSKCCLFVGLADWIHSPCS